MIRRFRAGCRPTLEMDGSVTVDGAAIRYRRVGQGGAEPLLMLHGLGGDHRGLLELAALLPGFDIVLPDLPGYGESPPLTEPHTLSAHANVIGGLRRELGLGACHLLGHSLGASIALVHAAGPDGAGLRSVHLINPVSIANGVTATLGKAYYRVAAVAPAPLARLWLASKPAVYVADALVLRTRDRERRRRILDQDYDNYRRASVPAMIESFLSYYETPFADLAVRITAPTLLVAGDRDGIAPPRSVTGLAHRMPAGQMATVAGAGHLLPMEDPAAVAVLVSDFLAAPRNAPSTGPQ